MFMVYYTNLNISCLFYRYWEMGLDGCKWSTLDDAYYK